MGWNESTVIAVLMLALLACELAACTTLVVLLGRAAAAWARRKRHESLKRVRGFDVKFVDEGPGETTTPAREHADEDAA
jgi:hypothetical protein